MPLGSFWFPLLHTKRVKKRYLQIHLRKRSFAVHLWYSLHCNVTVEITNIQCGLLSKHLFQRKQQYGSFRNDVGNDKFV